MTVVPPPEHPFWKAWPDIIKLLHTIAGLVGLALLYHTHQGTESLDWHDGAGMFGMANLVRLVYLITTTKG